VEVENGRGKEGRGRMRGWHKERVAGGRWEEKRGRRRRKRGGQNRLDGLGVSVGELAKEVRRLNGGVVQ